MCLVTSAGLRIVFCEEGSSGSRHKECGFGLDAKLQASRYCPTGTGSPKEVDVGYYTTPVHADANVREDQTMCESGRYCENGVPFPYTQWTKCDEIIAIDENPDGSASNLRMVFDYLAEKNSAIKSSKLILDDSAPATYFVEAMNLEGSSDSGDTASCISSEGFEFDGTVLNYVKALNYNDCKDGFEIKIKADVTFKQCETGSASGLGDCSSQTTEICTTTVSVLNVNDPAEFIEPNTDATEDCSFPEETWTFAIPEQSLEFTKVGDFGLEECVTDEDPADSVTFAVRQDDPSTSDVNEAGNGAQYFDINPCGGQIFVKEGVDLRFMPGELYVYDLWVVVSDILGATDEKKITIKLENINDPPTFNNDLPDHYYVSENQDVDTVVEPQVDIATDLDGKGGEFGTLEYKFLNDADGAFIIEASTGHLKTNERFNYEHDNVYYIKIQVTDNVEGSVPAETDLIPVRIQNSNDSPEFISNKGVEFEFAEINTVTGGIIGDISALGMDEDSTDSVSEATLTYSLHQSDGELSPDFEVVWGTSSASGKALIAVKRDTNANPFDFENDNDREWTLELRLRDDSSAYANPPSSVTLRLTNVNEAPYFDDDPLDFEVLETTCAEETYFKASGEQILPAQARQKVGSISANEVDGDQPTQLVLVTEDTPFAIMNKLDEGGGRTTWDIVVDKEVDYEAVASGAFSADKVWTLDFEARDGELSVNKQVTVKVLDCNERPTLVSDSKVRSVPENALGEAVTAVEGGALSISDLDTSDGKVFSIVGGNGAQFFTVNEEGVLKTKEELNYEIESSYYVEIQVTDDPDQTSTSIGGPATSKKVTYKIDVTNVNEAPELPDHDFTITESLKSQENIGQITVSDPDFSSDDEVTLEIVTHNYDVNTPSTDCADTSDAGSCCEYVGVLFEIEQNVKTREYDLKATEFTTDKPLNNLGGCDFEMTVKATDKGGLHSEVANFKLSIRGTNNAPSIEDQTFSNIAENPESGTVILEAGNLVAEDEDEDQELNWFLVGQNGQGEFSIDPITGAITVNDMGVVKMNYELNPTVTIVVGVRDDGKELAEEGAEYFDITDQSQRGDSEALYDIATITFKLKYVEEPPQFDFSNGVAAPKVPELTPHTTDFPMDGGLITAKDPDIYDAGKLTYRLSSEEGLSEAELPFGLVDPDPGSGDNQVQVYLKANFPIDFESKANYKVSVIVEDTTGLSQSYSTEILITDENEPPHFKVQPPHKFEVSEDTGGGVKIGDLQVEDPDKDIFSYTIESDEARAIFRIDDTGQLYMMAGAELDFEDKTSYQVPVRVVELGTEEEYHLESTVQITITDVNDLTIYEVSPVILRPVGGETINFTGTDMGPKDADKSSQTVVTATFVGPDNVIYTAKSCTVSVANTAIECITPPGIGVDHEWTLSVKAPNSVEWSKVADDTTSFMPPEITGIEQDEAMPTDGGSLVTLTGLNFGVDYRECTKKCASGVKKACGDECVDVGTVCTETVLGTACDEFPDYFVSDSVVVRYGPSEEEVRRYGCDNAKVSNSGSTITCESAIGVGKDFYWQAWVGTKEPKGKHIKDSAQSSVAYHSPKSSYIPPLIESVTSAADLKNNKEDDSTEITVTGTNFGAEDGQITLSYGHEGDPPTKYSAQNCKIEEDHTKMVCGSVPGVGTDMKFHMTVAGLPSNTFQSTIKYTPPLIKPLSLGIKNAVSGQGATAANTRGGEEINIFGENFGPVGDTFLPSMTYGPTGTEYTATDCVVRNSFSKIRCIGAPGTGYGHKVKIEVGGQPSPTYQGNVSYKPPSVYYFDAQWKRGGSTRIGGYTTGK